MHIIIRIIALQMVLGASLPAFSCSMGPDERQKKYTIDFYKESSAVITAKVTKITPSATKMSQLGIEAALKRLTNLKINLKRATDKRTLSFLPRKVDSAEKDYLKRKNNPEYAEMRGVREYSGPIKVEMIINKSFKGDFNEEDTIHFTANRGPYRGWGLCGVVNFYDDYLYSVKINQQIALYYNDDHVSHWVKFENIEEQHAELNRYRASDTFIGKVTAMIKSFISGK